MANVTLMGASYSDVPAVTLPQTGGGTVTFYENGSGGLEYETGTYTPTEDANYITINFQNAHTARPCFVMFYDASGINSELASSNSSQAWAIYSWYDVDNTIIRGSATTNEYARTSGLAKSSSSSSAVSGNAISTLNDSSSIGMGYWLSASNFKAGLSDTRYWRSNRTYKWIAIWAPTT